MKKIIRTNNLQKALEDYDALKGQAVSYVSELPESPNIRNSVYCKQSTTNIEESMVLTVDRLIENYAQETETANHFVIPETYTITYSNDVVKGIEVSGDVAIMYEDEDFTTALATTFNLEDNYIFDVITHVTEMAYYMGDAVNQVLHPVVSFGVIAEVHAKIDRVERELDAKIDNSYNTLDNKIDNEISNLAVNFATNNLVANVASINNATVTNASVSSLNVAEIIANGSAGTNGQILGKVNGNLEWQNFSTDNFVVNNITVNKNAVADNASVNNFAVANIIANESTTDNATINNMVVNNAILPRTVTTEVSYYGTDGVTPATGMALSRLKSESGFGEPGVTNVDYNLQFLPFITMPESEYNKGSFGKGNETYTSFRGFAYRNIIDGQTLAFVATAPFGNIYFAGKKIADANCDVKVEELELGGIRLNTTAPTPSLVFTDASVTNNFSFGVNVKVSSILGSGVFNDSRENLPYGIDVNNANGVITTNVKNTSFTTFESLFAYSQSMTDCFITNPSLIVNAPSGYNVLNNVTNMDSTFKNCYNFNQTITIPNCVTSMVNTFANCKVFNQPVTIPNNVTNIAGIFWQCYNFNQPVTIPNNVTNMYGVFFSCSNFNQPVIIPDSVTKLSSAFTWCYNFNSPVTIGKGVSSGLDMYNMFQECNTLVNSTVPIHISHEIALGNTSNYIYNCLVNGWCGITFAPSRILNDA